MGLGVNTVRLFSVVGEPRSSVTVPERVLSWSNDPGAAHSSNGSLMFVEQVIIWIGDIYG